MTMHFYVMQLYIAVLLQLVFVEYKSFKSLTELILKYMNVTTFKVVLIRIKVFWPAVIALFWGYVYIITEN